MDQGISRRAVGPGILLALVGGRALAQPDPIPWKVPDDAAIKQILVERVDVQKQGVGIVVGVVDTQGRRIVSHGALAKGDPRPLNGDTVFEIGSMTKVFTSLLLTDMVARGEVKLDDPVAKYLPAEVRVPQRGGRQITLVDLATHTSALPSIPTNFAPKDGLNPYADYTVDQLYAFLSSYTLTRDVGVQYQYSNVGMGLLGHALAGRAGRDYEGLVQARITGPLGMNDTAITLSPTLKARLAQGHTNSLEPTPNWDLPTLAGAGALRSTADDLLVFLAAELGFTSARVKPAMDAQLAVRRNVTDTLDIALGWHVMKSPAGDAFWHNGGTGGYRTFFGFDPKARAGVVVLTNQVNPVGGDDIGGYLLNRRQLAKLEPPRSPGLTAVTLSAAQLAPLVGAYELAPAVRMVVSQADTRLYAQITGQPNFEIFANGPNDFFWKVVDAQLTFQRGADGKVTGAVIRQAGRETPAKRVAP